jgi:hypothetical protein
VRALKPVFGLISTIFAVLYCGYLIHYFLHVSGSFEDAQKEGLGPTIVGLGIVGLFFLIVLIVKLVLIFVALRSPRSGGDGGPHGPTGDGDGGFDADAVIARYMARQSAEAASNSSATPTRPQSGGPPKRPGFGRKIG